MFYYGIEILLGRRSRIELEVQREEEETNFVIKNFIIKKYVIKNYVIKKLCNKERIAKSTKVDKALCIHSILLMRKVANLSQLGSNEGITLVHLYQLANDI